MVIVVVGGPVEGYSYFGPFETKDDAISWTEQNTINADAWWIAPLQPRDELAA
jgi:poly(3-hydroxyalkanoate) synthetase